MVRQDNTLKYLYLIHAWGIECSNLHMHDVLQNIPIMFVKFGINICNLAACTAHYKVQVLARLAKNNSVVR